jgi:hypothetical protein
MDVDRGQAHTLEAVSAAVVLLASLVFALQITAVTPLTASTASQHIENQQSGVAGGLLDNAAQNGTLKPTVLFWNNSSRRYNGSRTDENVYTLGGPNTRFGETLNETFLDRGIAFNMEILFMEPSQLRTWPVIDLGTPSDNAVTVTRTVTLYDHDELYYANGTRTGTRLNESTFFAEDSAPNSIVYNVVRVRLTVWRM